MGNKTWKESMKTIVSGTNCPILESALEHVHECTQCMRVEVEPVQQALEAAKRVEKEQQHWQHYQEYQYCKSQQRNWKVLPTQVLHCGCIEEVVFHSRMCVSFIVIEVLIANGETSI